jgi:hypothetical protein
MKISKLLRWTLHRLGNHRWCTGSALVWTWDIDRNDDGSPRGSAFWSMYRSKWYAGGFFCYGPEGEV